MPEISDVVRVTARITPQSALRREFGRTLYLYTAADTTDLAEVASSRVRDLSVREYSNLSAVGEDFPTSHVVYQAANRYFQQVPYPRNFLTAARFPGPVATYLVSQADINVGTNGLRQNGTVTATIAGQSVSLNLSAVTTIVAAATALQTAIRTISTPDLSGAVVTGANNRLTVRIPNGADIGAAITTSAGDVFHFENGFYPGLPSESVPESLNRIEAANDSWYWLVPADELSNVYATAQAMADWVGARSVQLIMNNGETAALAAGESTSIIARLFARNYDRTSIIWSRTSGKAESLAARFSSVNFDAANSLITGKFKLLPGTTADDLTSTQVSELNRKRSNYYTNYGGTSIVAEGVTLRANTYIDVRYWLDWIVNAAQVSVFNLLTSSRIAQTDAGVKAIQDAVESVLEQGINNGGAAPGRVSEALANDIRLATGNRDFDGFLSSGYLVYVDPIAEQSQSDRTAREAPPVRVWIKGSGAIHFANISLTFEN